MLHRPTKPLSGGCLVVSGGIWWCLEHVWWCLVVSDAGLVVSSGINVYRLIWPELIDVYGQISLPVHLTDAAEMLMLLMRWCCWCADVADAMLLLMLLRCCYWSADAADALLLLMYCCCWCIDAANVLMHWCWWCADAADILNWIELFFLWCCWCNTE